MDKMHTVIGIVAQTTAPSSMRNRPPAVMVLYIHPPCASMVPVAKGLCSSPKSPGTFTTPGLKPSVVATVTVRKPESGSRAAAGSNADHIHLRVEMRLETELAGLWACGPDPRSPIAPVTAKRCMHHIWDDSLMQGGDIVMRIVA
jgi:hypothetical protein